MMSGKHYGDGGRPARDTLRELGDLVAAAPPARAGTKPDRG
jgi:hypothetical protein